MIRKMTVVLKAAEGIQSHLSKRVSSSYRRESHRSFEEKIINHLEVTGNSSFRRESYRHFEKIAIIISKRQSSSFRKDSAASFQNDSFACDKSPINQQLIYVTHFEMIKNLSFGNDTHRKNIPIRNDGLRKKTQAVIVFLKLNFDLPHIIYSRFGQKFLVKSSANDVS